MTHILITRPLPAAQQLADQLAGRGLVPVVMPMYTFSECEPDYHINLGETVAGRRLAVFTSPRAVQFGLKYIPSANSAQLELAVVGSATRAALEASGFSVHVQAKSGYTSEDLLNLKSLAVDPGEAVIFCAPGGREKLGDGLKALGWKVEKALVYERVPVSVNTVQVKSLESAKLLVSVWTSNSAVDIAHEVLPDHVWLRILESPALVISARMQHHLQELGAKSIELSEGPGNPALLQSIMRINEQQGQA